MQWPKDKINRADNTMTKRQKYQEDRQYNDKKTKISGGQTIQWPKDVIVLSVLLIFLSFGHCIVCSPDIFVFWSLYCLSSCYFCLLVIVLSVLLLFLSFGHCIVCPPVILSFGHCIVCPPVIFVFWSLYCLFSWYFCLLVIVLSVLLIFC
jgi:hypothetical protein